MLDPNRQYVGDRAFAGDAEYLESLFFLMDLRLFGGDSPRIRSYGLTEGQEADAWEEVLSARTETSVKAGFTPALESAVTRAGGPPVLRDCLAYLLRIALEPGYEFDAAREQGKESLSLTDLFGLFDPSGKKRSVPELFQELESARESLELLFPQLKKRDMISALTPVMDERLCAFLTGSAARERLPLEMHRIPFRDERAHEMENTEDSTVQLLRRREETLPPELVVLWGPEGSGKETAAGGVAAAAGKRAVVLPLKAPGAEEDPDYPMYPDVFMLLRECVLTDSVPVIAGLERLPASRLRRFSEQLREKALPYFHTVYLLKNTEEIPDDFPEAYYYRMPELRTADRIALWESRPELKDLSAESLTALANTFSLTAGQIRRAAKQAARLAGPGEPVTEALLYQVCYALLGHPLKSHTQRVRSPFTWDDLKMAPADKALLKDLCRSVRNRHIVMQEWGFERKVPYGSGITGLFSGPPGTGKTMAAQVIANELHMELYKIDLSQLIDKYVGETEKNIRRVFDEAKKSNSVLFFDEADAIFNKRLEAGNSNERFANIESSLLLQCIEEYEGVALLATNNMTAIDAAFLRRFRYYLSFKEPDEAIRREIWSSVFPENAPLKEEVDFGELAHIFSFTGAIIKNVALQAAYLAADRGDAIGLLEIMVAVRRELEKNHRMLTREEMGSLGYLFPKVTAWNQLQRHDESAVTKAP